MKKLVPLILLLVSFANAQHTDAISFKDSISDMSMRKLDNLTMQYESEFDTLRGVTSSKALIEKSKLDDNNNYLARGYYSMSNFSADIQLREQFVDSMLFIAELSKEQYLLTDSYYSKGDVAYLKGEYESAMEWMARSYQSAIIDGNEYDIDFIGTRIAILKYATSRFYEAQLIYTNALKKYEKDDIKTITDKEGYMDVIYNLTLTSAELKQYDTTLFYARKGIHLHKFYKNDAYRDMYKRSEAIGLLGQNKLDESITLFLNTLNIGLSKHDLAHSHYYLGKAYGKKGSFEKSMEYFKKADSILTVSKAAPFPEIKTAYKKLYQYYDASKKLDSSQLYLGKYIKIDSLLSSRNEGVSDKMHHLYNLPRLHFEQEKQIQKKRLNQLAIISLVLLILGAMLYMFYQRKQVRIQKKRIAELLRNSDNTALEEATLFRNSTEVLHKEMGKDVVDNISRQLNEYEYKLGFLDSKTTLASLAKDLNTNTSYLSMFVNSEKGINFAGYIRDLRIKYAIHSMKESSEYNKYSMNGLASEFGFNNADSFSKAFKQVTKVSPSLFIKALNNRD